MRYIEYTLDFLKNHKNKNIAIVGLGAFPYFNVCTDGKKIKDNLYQLKIFNKNIIIIDTDNINTFLKFNDFDFSKYTLFLSRVTEHFRNNLEVFVRFDDFKSVIHIVPDMKTIINNLEKRLKLIDSLDFKSIFLNYDIYGGDDNINDYHGLYFSGKIINNIYKEIFNNLSYSKINIDSSPHFFIETCKHNKKFKIDFKEIVKNNNDISIKIENSDISFDIPKIKNVDDCMHILMQYKHYNNFTIKNLISHIKITDIPYYLWEICNLCKKNTKLNFIELNISKTMRDIERVTDLTSYYNYCTDIFDNNYYDTDNYNIDNIKKTFINGDMLNILFSQENIYQIIEAYSDDKYYNISVTPKI